jgi:3-oxoacyl-[acyl-carrier protein] reductase
MNRPLREQTVLVTGAGRGIGRAIAERFAEAGMNVVVHYRKSHEAARETAERCIARGAHALTVAADLQSREEVLRMKEMLGRQGLFPDILVNNAGIAHYGMLCDVDEETWDRIIGVNLKGTFLCTQAFMEAMVRQKYGRIINISSIWGLTGAACEVAYSAAKGGINAFTKALAKELAPSGVTVNAVAPGAVDTDMLAPLDQEERKALESAIPAGRFATPEEIASLVYFLAQPESGYITGQVISANGGWLA